METLSPNKRHDFDLEIVHHCFERTLLNDGTIVIENYLLAYHELCRFFKLTGRLFGFVAKDLESKIKAIEYHLMKDKFNYYTVQNMVNYEIAQGCTHLKGPHPSGCRTLLRLHHALEFIIAFINRMGESDDDAKSSKIAWEVYYDTLHNHHPWVTQKLAVIAVYALPSKKELINLMCKQNYENVLSLMRKVTDIGEKVYEATHETLRANDLLYIP